ncbi:hypothetical protein BH09VER1_BH09VER1_51400 [soil metagenome]
MKPDDSKVDETFDPDELDAAVNDRAPSSAAPEVDERTGNLTAWDEPPGAMGGSAPKVPPDDEATIGAELVDEGLDVADSEQRVASADPDTE